ncbi:hypothetical protein [Thorsellia anophelis]|uniref:Major paralogous domain-containing protein n=1 Tax=Thorsellia anophelis DSM 18579 TaxID=1123402 RepID=A0A1I0ALD6_9GAMM|nr:hypothetical protein [Thorsellia anophelis]SES95095.1 hypothetical protein SAMN02583745_00964 [Thorsellia anophelis DSM 18579]
MNKYLAIVLLLISTSSTLDASPKTGGYWQAAPNKFWPAELGYSFRAIVGNQIQQTTAANNVDVFCDSQGSGYRTPSIGEFNRQHVGYNPFLVGPRHFSGHFNNDITKAGLPNTGGRFISGSIFNEWGNLATYNNGWENNWYWAAEPGPNPKNTSFGRRLNFRTTDGAVAGYHNGDPGSYCGTNPPTETALYYWGCVTQATRAVACVRDLVPTPLNASPGKTS